MRTLEYQNTCFHQNELLFLLEEVQYVNECSIGSPVYEHHLEFGGGGFPPHPDRIVYNRVSDSSSEWHLLCRKVMDAVQGVKYHNAPFSIELRHFILLYGLRKDYKEREESLETEKQELIKQGLANLTPEQKEALGLA